MDVGFPALMRWLRLETRLNTSSLSCSSCPFLCSTEALALLPSSSGSFQPGRPVCCPSPAFSSGRGRREGETPLLAFPSHSMCSTAQTAAELPPPDLGVFHTCSSTTSGASRRLVQSRCRLLGVSVRLHRVRAQTHSCPSPHFKG